MKRVWKLPESHIESTLLEMKDYSPLTVVFRDLSSAKGELIDVEALSELVSAGRAPKIVRMCQNWCIIMED